MLPGPILSLPHNRVNFLKYERGHVVHLFKILQKVPFFLPDQIFSILNQVFHHLILAYPSYPSISSVITCPTVYCVQAMWSSTELPFRSSLSSVDLCFHAFICMECPPTLLDPPFRLAISYLFFMTFNSSSSWKISWISQSMSTSYHSVYPLYMSIYSSLIPS